LEDVPFDREAAERHEILGLNFAVVVLTEEYVDNFVDQLQDAL
jgi:hypothetical protein